MSKQKLIKICLSAILIISSLITTNAQEVNKLEASVTIIGFDFLSMIMNLYEPFDSPMWRVVFVVRVNKISEGQKQSQYLLVHYKFWYHDEKFKLPDDVRSGLKQWQTKLIRETIYDGKLHDILYMDAQTEDGKKLPQQPRLIKTDVGKNENLPLDILLPCYVTH